MKTIMNGPVLVIMVGPSGAGKSTWAAEHFAPREIVSSDAIRDWLTGDFTRQDKNPSVGEEMHRRILARLAVGQRVVVDATHLKRRDRIAVVALGESMMVPIYYVVVNRPLVGKISTGGWRVDVMVRGKTLIEAHDEVFTSNEAVILAGDYNKHITVIDTRVSDVTVVSALPRTNILIDLTNRGFNKVRVVGDVHGNLTGLTDILATVDSKTFLVFLGDIVDYGQDSWACVRYINELVSSGKAIAVRGNHDRKMSRYLETTQDGGEFTGTITYGMDISVDQLTSISPTNEKTIRRQFMSLYEQSPDWVEMGNWLFVHAAAHADMFGKSQFRSHQNSKLESMALYGETDGTVAVNGLPNRSYEWIDYVPATKNVVVGHQIMSVERPVVRETADGGKVVFLDTGSSKEVDGVSGFLSFMDFNITPLGMTPVDELTITIK